METDRVYFSVAYVIGRSSDSRLASTVEATEFYFFLFVCNSEGEMDRCDDLQYCLELIVMGNAIRAAELNFIGAIYTYFQHHSSDLLRTDIETCSWIHFDFTTFFG